MRSTSNRQASFADDCGIVLTFQENTAIQEAADATTSTGHYKHICLDSQSGALPRHLLHSAKFLIVLAYSYQRRLSGLLNGLRLITGEKALIATFVLAKDRDDVIAHSRTRNHSDLYFILDNPVEFVNAITITESIRSKASRLPKKELDRAFNWLSLDNGDVLVVNRHHSASWALSIYASITLFTSIAAVIWIAVELLFRNGCS